MSIVGAPLDIRTSDEVPPGEIWFVDREGFIVGRITGVAFGVGEFLREPTGIRIPACPVREDEEEGE